MNRLVSRNYRLSLGMGLAFLLLAILVACGPGEEPTPVPTPTKPAAVATPTPTQPAVVASPTPTTVASPTPTPGIQPQKGGRLKFLASRETFAFLIHEGAQALDSRWYTKLHNNLLANYDMEKVECEICSEWHLENNGKTMVFTLKQGIKFQEKSQGPWVGSNGGELTSADVKYSLKRVMGDVDGFVSNRGGIIKEYIESIDTPSKYEVRINLFKPAAIMPIVLSYEVMMIMQDGPTREQMKNKYFGSGPFVLREMVGGSFWKLDRNPNYWKKGLPYLDGVDITYVGDETTRLTAVLTGSADYFILPGAPPQQFRPVVAKAAAEGKVVLKTQDSQPIYCGHNGSWMNNANPPFNDVNMRKALVLAVDRKVIGDIQYGELFVANLMGMAEGMYFSQPESEVWNVVPGWGTGAKKQQEIEEAKQIVAKLYPNGIDVRHTVRGSLAPNSPDEPLQQMWAKVGIRSKIEFMSMAKSYEMMQKLDYDIVGAMGNCIPSFDPDESVGAYFLTGAARNWFGYGNAEVDRLYLQMSSELDPAKRRGLFHQIRDFIHVKDIVYAPHGGYKPTLTFNPRLQGYNGGISIAHASSGFQRADTLWIKK